MDNKGPPPPSYSMQPTAPEPQPGYGAQPNYPQLQPSSQTTVIVQQPQATGPANKPSRMWSTGLWGCCEDLSSCLLGCFCLPCFQCHLSARMGESCWVPICVPGAMIALRAKLRAEQGIQGSVCDDCLTMGGFTSACGACQMSRELDIIQHNRQ